MENDQLRANVSGARNIARKLLKDAKVTEIPVYLPKIINYLKTQHDLEVLRFPLGKGVDGLLVMIEGHPTIGFNPDRSWVRRRLTIAHEIGHLLMGHTCNGSKGSPAEKEAYKFAGELLMPVAFLRADFERDPNLQRLAGRYIVSESALSIHLMDCRII